MHFFWQHHYGPGWSNHVALTCIAGEDGPAKGKLGTVASLLRPLT